MQTRWTMAFTQAFAASLAGSVVSNAGIHGGYVTVLGLAVLFGTAPLAIVNFKLALAGKP